MFNPAGFMSLAQGLRAKVGSFDTGTGAVSSTVAVTGVGFTPKIVLFFWAGTTNTSDVAINGNVAPGMGAATGPSERCCFSFWAQDNVTFNTGSTRGSFSDSCILGLNLTTGAIDGKLDLQSLDSDGFTLVVDDAFASSYRIHYLALGGVPLTGVKAGIYTTPASGTSDTTFGFDPNGVFAFSTMSSSIDVALSSGRPFAFNMWDRTTSGTMCGAVGNTREANGYQREGTQFHAINTGGSVINGSWTISNVTNGFRLTRSAGGATFNPYIAIGGCSVKVGNFSTATNTTPFSITGVGFKPKAIIFTSHTKAQSAASTTSANSIFSFGAASGPTERASIYYRDNDNVASHVSGGGQEHDAVYINHTTANAVQGLMDLVSFDSDGFTLQMTDADPSAAFVQYMAIG